MRAQPVLSLALLLAALASCREPGDPGGLAASMSRRPGPVIHLVELSAEISGEPRTDDAVLAHWEGNELARWRRKVAEDGVRWISPRLGVDQVGVIELSLSPGAARRLDITPLMAGDVSADLRRARRVEVPLEKVGAETELTLHVDVAETLHGNWEDGMRRGRLVSLQLALLGARPETARLASVTLRRSGATLEPFAARAAVAERQGRLHPSWWVRGGAAAELQVAIPATGEPELRWYDAALGDTRARRIELLSDGEPVMLREVTAGGRSWRPRRASLVSWAGRNVRVRLSTEGDGVGLFGDPRVVTAGGDDRPMDVIVYLIDTLRADQLGAFGAPLPDASPTLDRLAEEGVAFELAISSSSWTKPAVATLMTGILPTTHRVGSRTLSDRLPASVALLQERFRNAGWRSSSFSANPLGSALSGLERGFDMALPPRFWKGRAELGFHPSGSQLREALLRWIDEEPERPFFAYVHVMEVHPHGRHRRSAPQAPGLSSYAAAVREADEDVGLLLDALAERGRDENLLFVVVADHGESWGAHGVKGHGTALYQEQIHIPLILWSRDLAARVVTVPVSLADVAPSLIDAFGLPPLEEAEGVSFEPLLGGGSVAPRWAPSALIRFVHRPDAPPQFSLVSPEGLKSIRSADGRRLRFDLRRDPKETGAEAPGAEQVERELEARLDRYPLDARAFRDRHGRALAGTLDPEELRRLQSLGYVP